MDDEARLRQAEERQRAAEAEAAALRARLERATAEREAMRECETRLRAIFDNTPSLVYLKDREGRHLLVNQKFTSVTGFSDKEVLGKTVAELFPPEIAEEMMRNDRLVLEGGEARVFEEVIEEDQARRTFVSVKFPLRDENGVIYGTGGISTDITERRRTEELLQAREALFRTFVDHVPAAVAMFDRDMHYLAVSRRWLTDYRLGERNIIGLSHYEVFPEIGDEWKAIHQRALAGNCARREEDPFPRADGTLDWVRWEIEPWYQPDGSVGGIIMFTEVITERVVTRHALERSNRALRMLSGVNEALIRADAETTLLQQLCEQAVEIGGNRMVWVGLAENDEFRTVRPVAHAGYDDGYLSASTFSWGDNAYGYGPVGLAIRTKKAVCFTDLRTDPRFAPWREEALRRGYESLIALPLLNGDRALGVVVLYSEARYAYNDEEVALLTALAGDVAFGIDALRTRQARREAEMALARERAYLDAAIELLPFPLFFFSPEMAVLRVNRAGRDLLHNFPAGEWLDYPLLTPETKAPIPPEERPFARALRGEVVNTLEAVTIVPSGEQIPVFFSAAPIFLDGALAAVVVTIQEISRLKEADQAKNQFLALLSHELKTPLTNIIGWGQFGQSSPEMAAEALDVIMRNAYAQRDLLERLIILSRMLTGKLTLHDEPLELWSLIAPAIEAKRAEAAEHEITLDCTPPGEPLPVHADGKLLLQAVRELLDNAVRFTPPGGVVTVTARRESERAVLRIHDTGRGIPPGQLPRLLKPFEQIQREEILGGLGIGLSLAQGIVKRHNGRVVIDSPGEGLGTTATVELPLAI